MVKQNFKFFQNWVDKLCEMYYNTITKNFHSSLEIVRQI